MKEAFKKIKSRITTIWIVLLSLPSKIFGQYFDGIPNSSWGMPGDDRFQDMYGVPSPTLTDQTFNIIKIVGPILILTTFIIGIINFFKIRKIDDEILKKRKTKKNIIIVSIVTIIIIALIITTRLIKKQYLYI